MTAFRGHAQRRFHMSARVTSSVWGPSSLSGLLYDFNAAAGVLTGSGVSQWTDQVSGITATQGTPGYQPAWIESDALFNGMPSLSFDGTDDYLSCTNAVSDWNFLHNGSGATVLLICSHKSTTANWYMGTTRLAAHIRGITLGADSATGRTGYYDGQLGNGGTIPNAAAPTKDPSASSASSYYCLTSTGTTPITFTLYASNQGGVGTSNSTINASSSDCETTMQIGRIGLSPYRIAEKIARILIWNRALTSGEVALLVAWAGTTYGARA